jgi:hypothetical protein
VLYYNIIHNRGDEEDHNQRYLELLPIHGHPPWAKMHGCYIRRKDGTIIGDIHHYHAVNYNDTSKTVIIQP